MRTHTNDARRSTWTACFLYVPVFLAACSGPAVAPDAGAFDWLAGCWRMDRDDGAYDEVWLPPAAGGSLGLARTVRDGRVRDWELMRLETGDDGLVFVAQPAGGTPVAFTLAERAPGFLAFENPQHDFPTRIEYRLLDFDALVARISGTVKGAPKTLEFPMRCIACEG